MLDPEKNRLPGNVKSVYMMGICGAGMSALAGILKDMGLDVRGSDSNSYPPMSDLLRSLNITIFDGYNPVNLRERPDLVVIGNVIRRDNCEVVEVLRQGIPYLSFPQAVKEILLRDKKSIVVAGTHGKTTTASIIAWILKEAGLKPGFIAGGIWKNIGSNFLPPSGSYFVMEGDEYDSAFFDKRPKFLHYNPLVAVITGIEFDHADIYRNLEEIILNFRRLIQLIPEEGLLVYNKENRVVFMESIKARSRSLSYGLSPEADFYIEGVRYEDRFTCFTVYKDRKRYMSFSTPLYGRHNLLNILGAIAVADYIGIDSSVIGKAIKEFNGVRRRLDAIGEKRDVLIIDDFAHHPTAVRGSIRAVRERFPERRLITVFEPRSNSSRRNVFQKAYALSFDMSDLVMIPEPPMMDGIPEDERFSSSLLVRDLRSRGIDAYHFLENELLLDTLIKMLNPGDIVLFMSNGAFDNLPSRLLLSL